MPQSHPTTDPYDFYHPYDFLPVRPSEAGVGILRRCCSHGHIRLWPHTAWHDCILMIWLNNSQDSTGTLCVQASCGPRTGIFNVFHILQGPCVTRKGAIRCPYGHIRELTQPALAKILHRPRIWPYGTRTIPTQLFTISKPYGARKLIMHALKLYGPHMGRQNLYSAVQGPWGPHEWTYDFCSKQPGNSPYGAWECGVTEA